MSSSFNSRSPVAKDFLTDLFNLAVNALFIARCLILSGEQQHCFAEVKTLVGSTLDDVELPEPNPEPRLNKLPMINPKDNSAAPEAVFRRGTCCRRSRQTPRLLE